ncbi:hypothetical protein, partial [Alloprevotella tannerae]|uniref:hypothetical protein n=1 Tax=Alloprevotella tannerae TaxID=76122 RepID=UPI0026EAD3D9
IEAVFPTLFDVYRTAIIYLADNCSREAHRLGAPLFVCVWLDSLTNIKKKSNACKHEAPSVARESRKG